MTESELRRELAAWMTRPITDITPNDVKAVIMAIADRGLEGQAHQIFSLTRAFFNWVVDCGDYGLAISPCARLKPKVLIGDRVIGDRFLKDHEIASYWKVADATPYPDL